MFCFKNIPTLIFAGDVDTSSNVDNAGFLPVFPPTNSNDTGKYSSGKFSLFLGFTTAKLLHICTKFHQRATLKLYCEWFFCPGTQPQSLSLWGRLQRPTLSFSPFTSNLVTGVKFFSFGQQNLIKKNSSNWSQYSTNKKKLHWKYLWTSMLQLSVTMMRWVRVWLRLDCRFRRFYPISRK